jgi:hypothetical protein
MATVMSKLMDTPVEKFTILLIATLMPTRLFFGKMTFQRSQISSMHNYDNSRTMSDMSNTK